MSAALGERDAAAVRDVLAALERDVEVTLELGPTATPVTLLAAADGRSTRAPRRAGS